MQVVLYNGCKMVVVVVDLGICSRDVDSYGFVRRVSGMGLFWRPALPGYSLARADGGGEKFCD